MRSACSIALGALIALLLLASSASADSLVYIGGDGNVWLANPDGSGQYQVTLDGSPADPYESPSQTDNGIIVAAKGSGFSERLYRMRQNGELLNPPVPTPAPPFGPKVAPDGSLVAYYTIAAVSYVGCSYCIDTYDQTLYSYPDRLTPYESIPMPHCCEYPSWMGSSSLLLTNGSATAWYSNTNQDTSQQWFADGDDTGSPSSEGLYDAELSPGGDRIAAVRGFEPETIALYETNGPPPNAPTIKCAISGAAPRDGLDYGDPTWSPDGRSLAWEEQGGVMIASIPSLDDCGAGGDPRLAFPGASDPDWSPAANAPPPRAAAGGGAGGGGSAGDALAPQVKVALARQRLRGALRKGLTVTVRCSEACSLTGTAELTVPAARKLHLARTVVVARGHASLKKAGKAKLRLSFTKRARKRLAHARTLKATLKVRAVDPARNLRTIRRPLTLKR